MRPGPRAACGLASPRRGTMSLAEQSMRMQAAWPNLRCTMHGSGALARLVCRGRLRPSGVTREYEIVVEYRLGAAPVAIVEHPVLIGRADQRGIPHTYLADGYGPLRPCLYYPRDGDWREDRALAWTIIPWLLEWLVEYEVWLVTGEWCGGGVDHGAVSHLGATAAASVGTGAEPEKSMSRDAVTSTGGDPASIEETAHD